jgi:hypothetical protein
MAARSQVVVQITADRSIGLADGRRRVPVRALWLAFSQFGCSCRPGTKKNVLTFAKSEARLSLSTLIAIDVLLFPLRQNCVFQPPVVELLIERLPTPIVRIRIIKHDIFVM